MEMEIKNVTKEFNGSIAVNDFSMEVHAGECIGLVGPNGAGKTTLMKIISDIMNPTKGDVLLSGQKISEMKKEMGYLPQYPTFYEWLTAKETLYFMGQLSGINKDGLFKIVPNILEKVGLSEEENSRVGTFSGGMKQRLGIAQALLHQPSLIVMDEPVSSLDPIGRREVLNIINEIRQETTILLSTHILGDLEEICDRLVIIKHGRKIEDTTMAELSNRYSNNKIRIDIADHSRGWIEVVKKLDYVRNVEVTGNQLKIEVEKIEVHKNMLLRNALKHNVNLLRFEIYKDTLEEIFLKRVVEQ